MQSYRTIVTLFVFMLLIGACVATPMAGMPQTAEHMDEADVAGEADHAGEDDHSAAAHDIPEEAAAVPNPVAVSDTSIAAGQAIYTQYCAVCHGPQGEGDGAAAAGLDPKPTDFHAAHVQELSDGALFYVITDGREGTAMVAWESILSEQQRWEVVNFLRTFEAADH